LQSHRSYGPATSLKDVPGKVQHFEGIRGRVAAAFRVESDRRRNPDDSSGIAISIVGEELFRRRVSPVSRTPPAFFSAARNGPLVFRGPEEPLRLTWVDRQGNVLERLSEPGRYSGLALAPGGRRAVLGRRAVQPAVDQDLWLVMTSGRSTSSTSFSIIFDWQGMLDRQR